MYKLYSIAGTCSTGITILLKALGQDVKIIQRDDVPNYSDIVPTNQVPALDIDGHILTEGSAIVLYLLEKHGSEMLPTDPLEKAEFTKWLMFNYSTLHPAYSKVLSVVWTMDDGEAKDKLAQQFGDKVSDLWAIIDKRLEGRHFVMGDKPTVIDYLLAVYSGWSSYVPGVDITLGKNVERVINDVSALPEFIEAFEAEGKEFNKAA